MILEYLPYIGIGFLAGFIGTSSGGSALFSIPILIFLGMSPLSAIATTKVSTLGTLIVGGTTFFSRKIGNFRQGVFLAFFSGIGAVLSALFFIKHTPENLNIWVNASVLFLLLLSFKKKEWTLIISLSETYKKTLLTISFFLVGVWGAILPGQGILATMSLVSLGNNNYLEAAATRKITGLIISLFTLFIFNSFGLVDWDIGLTLLLGTSFGAYLGSLWAIKKGNTYVRTLFIFVTTLVVLRNLFF